MFSQVFPMPFPAEYETIQRNENPRATKNTGFRGQAGYPPLRNSAIFRVKGGGGLGPYACRDLTRPSPLGCRHIRVMVSTDIQGADFRVASSDRDTFCKVVANSSHPRTVPDLPDAA